MRKYLLILLTVFFCACSGDNADIRRTGQESGQDSDSKNETGMRDEQEMADEDIRFSWEEKELRDGEPGILYSIDNDHTVTIIRNITTGDYFRFTLREGTGYYNGEVIVQNARTIKTSTDKTKIWYKGISSLNQKPVYVVVEYL